ncbi:hypothetical protein [Acidovorax radicis]|uniref:hypothetical protein n=1 Tax=Acidovorax radicis TaxID=758826 RepID=UPI001CFB0E54|nr:hypothetical protein [Acidovorax radicis]UCU99918.1 hypothetical protein KI609_03760 [Acidovorax radicis]
MNDITKEELKSIVFVTAVNECEMSDQVQVPIEAFDANTYRHFLNVALSKRAKADHEGAPGGGAKSVADLTEAIKHLDHILSK